jgi:hypothetical protein
VGPRASLDAEARRKILCPCQGSNPDRPARSQTHIYILCDYFLKTYNKVALILYVPCKKCIIKSILVFGITLKNGLLYQVMCYKMFLSLTYAICLIEDTFAWRS